MAKPSVNIDALNFMINHVFLPPRLPQTDDTCAEHVQATVQALCDAVSRFLSLGVESQPSVQTVLGMLQRFRYLEVSQLGATGNGLRNVIANLKHGGVALVYLKGQNAGLLVTAENTEILFEAFELLAPNEKVMSCKGALRRQFPDTAAAIPRDRFQDSSFVNSFVSVLHELDTTTAPIVRPKAKKAGVVQSEQRDTVCPILATGMLVDILAGLGTKVDPIRITKRSREQVNWKDAKLSFHRSPVWLLLRVAMRLVLDRQAALDHTKSQYKSLMAYHHAHVLEMATKAGISSDKLFSMTAKLARRIMKLGPDDETAWVEDTRAIIRRSQAVLQARWEEAQRRDTKTLRLGDLANLSFRQDTELKLEHLNSHLSWVRSRSVGDRDPMGPGDTTQYDPLPYHLLPVLRSVNGPHKHAMQFPILLEFEAWVELGLPIWLGRQLSLDSHLDTHQVTVEASLRQLQNLIKEYRQQALGAYKGIPGGLSVMYLVIMELWIAMDRIAGSAIPLLLDYDPGFSAGMFGSLLLEREEDMRRLKSLEDYLIRRKTSAPSPYPSAFSGFGRKNSFAVRFYQSSAQHQTLRGQIEEWAAKMKEEKLEEYREMKEKYDSLDAKYSSMPCEAKSWDSEHERFEHAANLCDRCKVKQQMGALNIQGFEWPLPKPSQEADAVVFEISVPNVVSVWRSVTWELVTQVFQEADTHHEATGKKLYFAKGHSGLSRFLKSSSAMHPGSTVKYMEVSHYQGTHIVDATPGSVCPPHAARYGYYHQDSRAHLESAIPSASVPRSCSYANLIAGSILENWVSSATHEPNTVIARQFECPLDMTLEEYRSFGGLRSSANLQWANILCQLTIPSLDLNKTTTLALILQACLEAGPPGRATAGFDPVLREIHADIRGEIFMGTILQALSGALERARPIITQNVAMGHSQGLDSAVKRFWADYSPQHTAHQWTQVDVGTRFHILTTTGCQLRVTFNLLTGDLFVNGHPLSKLPQEYQKHETFVGLFGDDVLDVGPSRMPTMQFSTCRHQHGWVVHFALKDGQLVVRTARERPQTDHTETPESRLEESWEYVPKENLKGDLPHSFVNDFAHWLDLDTNDIEFRPMDTKWESSPDNWRLTRTSGRSVLKRGSSFIVDPQSPTVELTSRILDPMEDRWNINPIFDNGTGLLILELPRLSMSFFVRDGHTAVRSKNYPGMHVDEQQRIGSLIGLKNRLVLKPESGLGCRILLVPRGRVSVSYNPALYHTEVTIEHTNQSSVRHDAFLVDDKLGYLKDAGSLQSKLHVCLLHALTSHCLPDPLTLRTGTEEALRLMSGAAMRSYHKLDSGSCSLLSQIAKCSPVREFYPSHLQVMERVEWNDRLPSLSQHEDFFILANGVFEEYRTYSSIFPTGGKDLNTGATAKVFADARRSVALTERARIRNATFRLTNYGAEHHTTDVDEEYRLDNRNGADKSSLATRLVSCVDKGEQGLLFPPSPCLQGLIIGVNSQKFCGKPEVDLAFRVDCFTPPSMFLEGLWCGLHLAFVSERDKYKKMMFLSGLLYAENADRHIVQVLMALGNITAFSEILPPTEPNFDLSVNSNTLGKILEGVVRVCAKDPGSCPEPGLTRHTGESARAFKNRQNRHRTSKQDDIIRKFAAELRDQTKSWVLKVPSEPEYRSYLKVKAIMTNAQTQVDIARRSQSFRDYLTSLCQKVASLELLKDTEVVSIVNAGDRNLKESVSKPGFISVASFFAGPAPNIEHPQPQLFPSLFTECYGSREGHRQLSALVDSMLGMGGLQYHQILYLAELRRSMSSTQPGALSAMVLEDDTTIQEALRQNLQGVRVRYTEVLRQIELDSAGTSIAHQICATAGMQPRISPVFLLQRLARGSWGQLSQQWRHSLVAFALHLIELQRAERLFSCSLRLSESRSDLLRELSNAGDHKDTRWNPLEYPESLVLEIEQGIMIRPVQNEIAAKMRSPPEMRSSVMQLNMGEGKSSVIVPVVASSLADGNRLVRVVVAKPQSSQMRHMLIDKLGRLINRQIFYLPTSRATSLSESGVAAIRRMVEKCKQNGGILLVQPEHLLSFKLMGIDKSWVDGDGGKINNLGRTIIQLHQDMEADCRDIVDESDDNFSVKFELVYTMGSQEAVDMAPGRWNLAQELLGKMESIVRELMMAREPLPWVSEGVLFEDHGPGRVATIRILGIPEGRRLIATLAGRVCESGLQGFPIQHQLPRIRRAVLEYINTDKPAKEDISVVETCFFGDVHAKNALLLLRGLLAKGVVLFALRQKRFRVNYGLAPDRCPPTMLAVPYRAKDMPSPRSEFSQTDVAIILTCLSYYYRGLSAPELYHCIELLRRSDQAEEEYGIWAKASPFLPPSFGHFSSINPKDRSQCEEIIFPTLKYSKPTIDFYLSRVVFSREMKQFPLKLSASGWDLAGSKNKNHPLTGFSGTNDSKGVLPLSVTALDVQPHTNATVLSTLLREENMVVELADSRASQLAPLTEAMLIEVLRRPGLPEMQVVLDVGAQIVESSNAEMAKKLLAAAPTGDADAVIFFSDGDDLSVLTRDGTVHDFLTSPFASHTDRCFVFLDQAHTRGTDLKLPDKYRAAVTLGPGLTKDALVQACMRMRKLGRGQSVTFLVSPEMGKRIRSVRGQADGRPLKVSDILAWAISETWEEAVRSTPLWATQGIRYLEQEAIWKDAKESDGFSTTHVRRYLEPEGASLEQRYSVAPIDANSGQTESVALLARLRPNSDRHGGNVDEEQNAQAAAIREKLVACCGTSGQTPATLGLEEEQERELAPEMEQESQIARPEPYEALPHSLEPALVEFSRTGRVLPGSAVFLSCYVAMTKTSSAPLFHSGNLSLFPGNLLVTKDFSRTVEEKGPAYCSDSFQRGVQWVLVGEAKRHNGTTVHNMVVISQWEASRIKPLLEDLERQLSPSAAPPTTLHAYLPLSSLTFRTMEDLDTYVVPASATGRQVPKELVTQLNLFAGQLYLRCYHEYLRLCRYLGLAHATNTAGMDVGTDGFVGRRGYPECEFDTSPVPFLVDMYLKIRRDGVDFKKTHMGAVLGGDILTPEDFTGEPCGCHESEMDLGA
ncbi:hypothetical protein B0T16DRAFT_391740 [Cercophora newfieldiana]|uniref:ubiquitinyl hydrolase 1 n=1 Tax=Cercophora newfieldiana TaxID=92897 RepID=A0AA39XZH4_9PEZI|nr:hypothetical protein B0T16DRAFT_391740 [Cercophora newfieldiana]